MSPEPDKQPEERWKNSRCDHNIDEWNPHRGRERYKCLKPGNKKTPLFRENLRWTSNKELICLQTTVANVPHGTWAMTTWCHTKSLLLLLLSRFSRVRLCATPETAAHQAPPSLGLSKQEHWSGLPLPSPVHESEKWKWSRSVVSDSLRPHGLQPTRLLCPWDFLGKSTGAGCHCLLLKSLRKTKSDQTNFPPYSDPWQEKRNATNMMPTDSKNHPTSSLLRSLCIWWSPASWTAVELVRSVFQSNSQGMLTVKQCQLVLPAAGFPGDTVLKNPPANAGDTETRIQSLCQAGFLE